MKESEHDMKHHNESLMNKEFHLTEVTLKENFKARIYDNCLPSDDFKLLKEIILSPDFSWNYNSNVVSEKYTGTMPAVVEDYVDDDMFQFTHLFYVSSPGTSGPYAPNTLADSFVPIFRVLNAREWLRIKANLGTKDPEHMVGGWHCDLHWPKEGGIRIPYDDTLTAVLYMNTNNGYTLLETGHKVESVENRLVIFPNNVLHTGISQTDTNTRVLINFNFWM